MRRRTSLILGVLLALLLGVAAAFFVLAMPIRMLESVTTLTRLSKLMVQAEPPISPNDRMLLSVLAGILATGLGWVLVDWMLFGRVGMSTLIRSRDDDYEDEDGDAFRPTDPLDLVAPVPLPGGEWAPQGDARRPLSARTDIGEPMPYAPPLAGFGAEQGLPPINQILPSGGLTATPPPLFPPIPTPGVPPQMPSPAAATQASPPPLPIPGGQMPASWPPLDAAAAPPPPIFPPAAPAMPAPFAPQAPAPQAAEAPVMPSWLPAPGARVEAEAPVDLPGIAEPEAPAAPPEMPVAEQPPLPSPPPFPPIAQDAPIFQQPVMPPPLIVPPPIAMPPVEPEPAPAPVAFEPVAPVPAPYIAPPPEAAAPPPPAPAPVPVSAPRRPSEPGFDKARLEELLERLERGMQNRRAGNLALPAPTPAPAPAPQPIAPPVTVAPPPVAAPVAPPPAAFSAPPPVWPAPTQELAPMPAPPPAFAAMPQPPAFPPIVPPPIPQIVEPAPVARDNDQLLDQPLHQTLDLLRSMVKR